MRLSRRHVTAFSVIGVAGLGFPVRASADTDAALAAAIASPTRTIINTTRDRYRHPNALLDFFGLHADDSVLEIEPGAGYWTEILAPYLKAHGSYRAAVPVPPVGSPAAVKAFARFTAKLRADPLDYGRVIISPLKDGTPLAPDNSVDLVLSFRNLHDWMADGTATAKLAAIHAVLRSGGLFGIEDHRGLLNEPQDPCAQTGYVREDYARALIEKAKFKFVSASAIGDNLRDTKNYPDGVWTLPPVLRLGTVNRFKYLAIGESDRWTMKFIKA